MKRLLTICLIMATVFTVNAQSYNGNIYYEKLGWDGITANCNVSVIGTTSQNGIYFESVLKNLDIKSLTIAQKIISGNQIPSNVKNGINNDARVRLDFDVFVNNVLIGRYGSEKPSVSWTGLQGLPNSDGYKPAVREAGYALYNNGAIEVRNVRVNNLSYRVDQTYYEQIRKDIAGIKSNTTSNSSNQSNNNNGSTEVLINEQSATSNAATSTKPIDNYNAATGLYTNPLITGSNDKNSLANSYAQGQQIADLAVGIADLFTPSPEEQARKEKQRLAQIEAYEKQKIEKFEAEKRVARDRFQNEYMPLLHKAEKGDETARMILYYASFHLYSTEYVPKRDQWLDEAYINKNPVARMEVANKNIKNDNPHWISWLQRAADAGSPDAMLRLADYYDRKSNIVIRGSTFTGGDNAKLALELYTKAAERGSPNAMYYLGMIYKYGQTPDITGGYGFLKKVFVLHDVVIDEMKAFEWFKKSIESSHNVSLFAKGSRSFGDNYTDLGSYFEKKAYRELSLIYKKGKIVPKDKAKAKELMQLYESYGSKYDKYEF